MQPPPLAPAPRFDPRTYGAIGNTDGTTGNGHDDTAAFNAAAAAAALVNGIVSVPALKYRLTAPWNVGDVDVEMDPAATIYADHDGIGVNVENTSGTLLLFWRRMFFGRIIKVTKKWRLGTDPGSIGLRIVNATNCVIRVMRVENFDVARKVTARNVHGNSYNTYGSLYDSENRVGLWVRPETVGAWCNENHFEDRRITISGTGNGALAANADAGSTNVKVSSVTNVVVGHKLRIGGVLVGRDYQEDVTVTAVGTAGASGTGIDFTPALALDHKTNESFVAMVAGTRAILIEEYPGAGGANNLTWDGCSIEGDYFDAKVECNNALEIHMHDMRYECSLMWAKILLSGSAANQAEHFLGGYDSTKIWIVKTGTVSVAARTHQWNRDSLFLEGQPGYTDGIIKATNHGSSGAPFFMSWHAGLAGISQWAARLAANLWEMKGANDRTPRVRFDPINGRIGVGTGAFVASSHAVADRSSSANNSGQPVVRIHDPTSFVVDKAVYIMGVYYAVASIAGQYLTLATNLAASVLPGVPVVQVESTTIAVDSPSGQPVLHLTSASGFVAGRAVNVNGTLYSIKSVSGSDVTLTINLGTTQVAGGWVLLWGATFENSVGTARVSSLLGAEGGLTIGGGSRLWKHISGTATWDLPSTESGSFASTTITVAGAAVGDECSVPGFTVALPAGTLMTASVTAPDTVTVVFGNFTGAPVDLGSGTVRVSVWQH